MSLLYIISFIAIGIQVLSLTISVGESSNVKCVQYHFYHLVEIN